MMRKKSIRESRTASIISQHRASLIQKSLETPAPPNDTLHIKIKSLRTSDQEPKHFAIKVTFFDQLLVHAIIKSNGSRDEEPDHFIANGTFAYDPSDYEKMCLLADNPLVVHIQPLRNIDVNKSSVSMDIGNFIKISHTASINCCNVDILPIFIGSDEEQKMCIRKRLEPMVPPATLNAKSWDTLPLLTMELDLERDPLNKFHHRLLQNANWMKITLIGSYNMFIPFEKEYLYTAATKAPLYGESKLGLVTFSQGVREPRRFKCMDFYPKWESLRSIGELFTKSDVKLQCKLEDLLNDDNIDLPYYLNQILPYHTCVWGSFHRTLMLLDDYEQWLWRHIRSYKWPLEIHIYGETGGYSFMAFINLFQLLFPGEHTVRIAVPLKWVDGVAMMKECGCELLLTPNEKPPVITDVTGGQTPPPKTKSSSKGATESMVTSVSTLNETQYRPTGSDANDAFVFVEVQFGRPLKAVFKPPKVLKEEITAMLTEMELEAPRNRACTGRGQPESDWQKTIRAAANALRKVPYYGVTEFCTFNRQLSETRTRVELTTSFWQNAAIYVNNNFIVKQYLDSDEKFEELVMMAHACLMRSAAAMLIPGNTWHDIDPVLRAARHARQMQDYTHAMELYLQLVVDKPKYPHYWRELSTCMKDLDKDWAIVCLNKAIVLDPRSPLTLLSKGAMLFEDDPTEAEPFFFAILEFNPYWTIGWVITSVYFYERELYHLSDTIMQYANKLRGEQHHETQFSRSWERELGDWWDSTPLLPGMSLYYEAADLLLRLRAVPLAEACLARLLSETVETTAYYHLVGVCCRLRGQYKEAICHLTVGLGKFGEINYLRSLEAECQHRLGNIKNATESFAKVGTCVNTLSILMSLSSGDNAKTRSILMELIRRQASAYSWTALADNWVRTHITNPDEEVEEGVKSTEQLNAKACAIACAVQALKIDRRAGRAWAILGKLVKPSARRLHCLQMASSCGWEVTDEDVSLSPTPCHFVGSALRECRCYVCDTTKV
ncbi:uncharacterized protein LOC118265098 [Spodoptera frugiperda]|uniref:Uncharacterized protein LOC118265098 n=1 Tax=Spodoptera frugiperda TaxID=7108 RepID=A0A9R0E9B8_SPOFR|nr:uncharacterized protein LOC118265098 [Spodoptera frugiperda]